MAVDSSGVLYAATSPDGKVYRIENGKATEFFAPQGEIYLVAGFAKDGSAVRGRGRSRKYLSRG